MAIKIVSNGVWKVIAVSLLGVLTTSVVILVKEVTGEVSEIKERTIKNEICIEHLYEDVKDIKHTTNEIHKYLLEEKE